MTWPFDTAPDPFVKLPAALRAVAPTKTDVMIDAWCKVLVPPMKAADFTTPKRIAAALGQMAVESEGFTTVTENLNYSAAALREYWPSHFNVSDSVSYARQPERIANRAYANRMGNGNEASGDGWRYRGAGLIQLTGKTNQAAYAASVGKPVEQLGDYLRTAPGAAESACWFLTRAGLNQLADGWQLTVLSRAVNGGNNGLSDRIELSNAALKALS